MALVVFTNALQDILGADLRQVEEMRIARNLPEHGRHQFRVGERLVVEVDLNLQQFARKVQMIVFGGVFQRFDVFFNASYFLEEIGKIRFVRPSSW